MKYRHCTDKIQNKFKPIPLLVQAEVSAFIF